MSFSNIRFSSDPSSITSLGIMLMLTLMLMVFIHYYFYSKASSSISAAPKEEKSSSNSSEPKTMVSTSTSCIQKNFKYDVFLSFRGEDTRKNFVDHLYHALMDKGIFTYKDDEKIKKGKRISDDLFKSIEDSKFYIIVFSKNYASSSWCLEELVKIMECQKMTGHTAYPVFYDVEPTEVRKQTGAVGEAFAKHENEEAAGKWREVLKEASDLAGWELKNTLDGHEAKFIRKIVQEISLELRSINFGLDEKLVGMETRVKDVVSSLETSVDDVRMIGIKGMGGIGKTTLARAIFDRISIQFESQSFVENVREISKNSLSGLKKLQKQVLSDVLNDNNIGVSSVYDGKNMMKKFLHSRKVLVVLDDVDHIEQLEALTVRNWFKPGSTIIITTRDEQVLRAHGVNSIHDVNLLSNDEAICMFHWYAFGRDIEIEGYKELSREVVRYAAGLPLTIKVLGSDLCGKNKIEWEDAIERLKTIPLKKTMEKLEISFDGLEKDYQEIFLDVACMLKGWDKNYAIIVLESRGFRAIHGLRVLEQKSLIIVSENGFLRMHDHLEEMGRNIVRRKHPDEPNKHSRLWIEEEIEDILANDLGTQATKCLYIDSPGLSAEIAVKGLAKMKDLRYIDISFMHDFEFNFFQFDKVSEYLPNSLRFILWDGFPSSSLPNTFQGKYLVGLEMCETNIVQLWEDGEEKVLHKLRFLTFRMCPNLQTFDLRVAPNLEQLTISYCWDFVELHMPVESPKLEEVNISHSKLKTLYLGSTPNLKRLTLEESDDLVELQMPAESPKLEEVNISHSKLKTLYLGSNPNLKRLTLEESGDFVELHMPVESPKLEEVNISHSKLKTLYLGSTPNLKRLTLEESDDLVELQMPVESLKLEELNLSHSKLRTLDLGLTPNLKRLNLENCYDLVETKAPVGCLRNLAFLELSGCGSFKSFLFDKQLDSHGVGSLSELHLIAEPTNVCSLHSDNKFPKLKFSCYYKEDPASSFGNLERLISMGLYACTNLEKVSRSICSLRSLRKLTLEGCIPEVPRDLDQLECLEELIFSSTNMRNLRDSICKLKHLKSLELKSCLHIEKLPDDFGQIKSLETLIITDCNHLRDIPNSICKMKCINSFDLRGCIRVVELPEDIGCLEGLKELNIEGTGITRLPDSLCKLKHLKSFKIKSCWHLEKLPEDLGRLQCLEELDLTECIVLRDIPNSICQMKSLKYFHLPYCFLVEKLPEEIGSLKRLEELNIEGMGISHLPQSIFQLKRLRIIGFTWQLLSYGFSTVFPTSTYVSLTYTSYHSSANYNNKSYYCKTNWEAIRTQRPSNQSTRRRD